MKYLFFILTSLFFFSSANAAYECNYSGTKLAVPHCGGVSHLEVQNVRSAPPSFGENATAYDCVYNDVIAPLEGRVASTHQCVGVCVDGEIFNQITRQCEGQTNVCESPLTGVYPDCSCPDGTDFFSASIWAGLSSDACLEPCATGATRDPNTMVCSCPAGQVVNEVLNSCGCPDLDDLQQTGVCNRNNCTAEGKLWSPISNQCIDDDDCVTGDPDGDGVCGCPDGQIIYGGACTASNCVYDQTGKMLCDVGDPETECVTDSATGAQFCTKDADNCITNDEGKKLCESDLDRNKDGDTPDPTSNDCQQDLNSYQTQCTTGCANNGGVLSFNGSCTDTTDYTYSGGFMTECKCSDGTTPNSNGTDDPTAGDGSGDSQTSGDAGAIVQSNLDGAKQVTDKIGTLESQLTGVNQNLNQGLGALNQTATQIKESLNGSGNVEVPTLGDDGLSGDKNADSLDDVIQQYKDDTDELITELNTKFTQYTSDLSLNFLPDLTGSSSCPSAGSTTTSLGNVEFDFCRPEFMQAWEIIRAVLLFGASLIALFILFRPASKG